MRTEGDASGVESRRSIFLLPHPDDEFGVFAEIDATRAAGNRALCIFLTDGAAAGQSPERRNAESTGVLQKLGVDSADIAFLGCQLDVPDGSLAQHLTRVKAGVEAIVGASTPFDRIYMPAWEGGHQDHDAAHLIGLALAGERRTAAFQFSLYHGEGLPGILFRVLAPLPQNGAVIVRRIGWRARFAYLRHCLSYPSQWKTWVGLWPLVLVDYVMDGSQKLQRVTPDRVREPPHAGRVLYERRGFCSWREFEEATRDFRSTIPVGHSFPAGPG
jgi:LmbE family N-acetylglucosaminyl deacetylase